MNRRNLAIALCGAVLAASALMPTAEAATVGWSVSVGVPGFAVSAGQPGYYGGRGYYGAPYRAVAYPYYRPYFRPAYRPPLAPIYVGPRVVYPYYPPAPVVYAPQPFAYGYPAYTPAPLQPAPGSGSY